MIITQTLAKLISTPQFNYTVLGNSYEIDHENGDIPALTIEYDDGDKFLVVIPDSPVFSFINKTILFNIEEYMWNKKFERWDRTDSGKFTNNLLTISNGYLVDSVNGKPTEDLTQEELELAEMIGEYSYWFKNLGRGIVVPQLLNAVQKRFQPKPEEVIPEE